MTYGRVVCNAGPLIALASIDQLEIIRGLFREVLVPQAVHQEILRGGIHLAGLACYQEASWINVLPLM